MSLNQIKHKFKKGDKVFAKVKGFPYWPAIIENVDLETRIPKYNVIFYGTQEVGVVRENNICLFAENKGRFAQLKLKSKVFIEAMKEANLSLNNTLTPNPSCFKNNSISRISPKLNNKTLQLVSDLPSAASSPINFHFDSVQKSDNNSQLTCNEDKQTLIIVSHKGVNTTSDLDLDFQLHALTDRCIELEKSLLEHNGDTTKLDANRSEETLISTSNKECQTEFVVENYWPLTLRNNSVGGNQLSEGKENIIEQLMESKWVTDDTLQMYFDLLNNRIVKKDVYFVTPTIAEAIKSFDAIDSIVQPLELNKKPIVFIPVSDSPVLQNWRKAGGTGTHWSLLLFIRSQNRLFYFDSIGQHNLAHAHTIARKVWPFFNTLVDPKIEQIQSPQQTNNVDCGIYTLLVTDAITVNILQKSNMNLTSETLKRIMPSITEVDVLTKRAVLALMFHKNQHTNLQNHILQELMFNKALRENNVGTQQQENKVHHELSNPSQKLNTDKANGRPSSVSNSKTGTSLFNTAIKHADWKQTSHNRKNSFKAHNKQPEVAFEATTKNRFHPLSENFLPDIDGSKNMAGNFSCNRHKISLNRKNKGYMAERTQTKYSGKEIKLSLYSDSQGRGVGHRVSTASNDQVNCVGQVMPNAPLSYVTKAAMRDTNADVVLIVGGTNDILNDDLTYIYQTWEHELIALSKIKPIIITTIPEWFVCHNMDQQVHLKLFEVNNFIRELTARISNVYLVDLGNLQKFHYKGIHLNKRGKTKLTFLTIDILNRIFDSVLNDNFFSNDRQILVSDIHMGSVFSKFCNDPSVAFSHCISADFGEENHMSAGVAVAFGNSFGKPSARDLVSSHLTFQQRKGGPGVYGLVTKTKYNAKPSEDNYDCAFDQLTNKFMKGEFKHLICSPMGCMRDKIKLDHFASNITKFQQETGSTVNIITYSKYWNQGRVGLSHKEFINILNEKIYKSQRPTQIPPRRIDSTSELAAYNVCSAPPIQTPSLQVVPGLLQTQTTSPGNLSYAEAVSGPGCIRISDDVIHTTDRELGTILDNSFMDQQTSDVNATPCSLQVQCCEANVNKSSVSLCEGVSKVFSSFRDTGESNDGHCKSYNTELDSITANVDTSVFLGTHSVVLVDGP